MVAMVVAELYSKYGSPRCMRSYAEGMLCPLQHSAQLATRVLMPDEGSMEIMQLRTNSGVHLRVQVIAWHCNCEL